MVIASIIQKVSLLSRFVNCKSIYIGNCKHSALCKSFSASSAFSSCCPPQNLMDLNKYEKLSDETLELLYQQFEEIIGSQSKLEDSDVELNNGVLTVKLAGNGTYVINKQSPNRQIWLSSPFSGPKRYDWSDDSWVYKRDQTKLHLLLNQEISLYIGSNVNFDLDSLKRFV